MIEVISAFVAYDQLCQCCYFSVCFEEPDLSFPEWVRAKVTDLIFNWEWPPRWQRIAAILELFIMDAFADLFITFCIIVNTVFMAMDHSGIKDDLLRVLTIGNYVMISGNRVLLYTYVQMLAYQVTVCKFTEIVIFMGYCYVYLVNSQTSLLSKTLWLILLVEKSVKCLKGNWKCIEKCIL